MPVIKHPEWPGVPDNRDDFIRDIMQFYAARGVPFEPNPKVALTKIDLWDLFNLVEERGGYDVISAEKLAWRRLAEVRWGLGGPNGAAYAFQLKTVYYKNLSAYWLARRHKQEPPPREILEDRTAKGADLLNRTVETYDTPQKSASHSTPKVVDPDGDRMDMDDGGSGARTTRLRQAPPQRQFFQPDLSSTRQPRQSLPLMQSPQPLPMPQQIMATPSPAANLHSASFNIGSWEGRPNPTAHMIPVMTPSTNPGAFQEKLRKVRQAHLIKMGIYPEPKNGMPPGTGYPGPNIYIRSTLALKSGIPAEQDYALHHLLKMSHERGDKFRFEDFPGLSDALIDKALEISSLFYEVKWEVNYEDLQGDAPLMTLDGCKGTSNLLEQLSRLETRNQGQEVTSAEFQHKLSKCTEAAMILRNMSLLESNSIYLSKQWHMRDLLTIWLNLPRHQSLIELTQYALETTEQLVAYWKMDEDDALYLTLQRCLQQSLERQDKGCTESSLRALSSISMKLETSNALHNMPMSIIKPLLDWVLVDDEDLLGACFDFLYQFTAVPDNLAFLLERMYANELDLHSLIRRLSQCLFLGARDLRFQAPSHSKLLQERAKMLAPMPSDLLEEIRDVPEPKRSSMWLRALFEEDAHSDITQIDLWNAYQRQFSGLSSTAPLLAAADFIKNVSTTFTEAKAEVIQNPPPARFIIKGIKYRHVPVYFDGKGETPYLRCMWHPGKVTYVDRDSEEIPMRRAAGSECGTFHRNADKMFDHIMAVHLGYSRNNEAQWVAGEDAMDLGADLDGMQVPKCSWSICPRKASSGGKSGLLEIARHIKTHLPDTTELAGHRAKFNKSRNDKAGLEPRAVSYRDTLTTPDGHPTGLPFTAMLLLRMMARNVPKAVTLLEANGSPAASEGGHREWMELLFFMVRDDLFRVAAFNRSLNDYVWDVVGLIDQGLAEQ